jgi:hypothetical protein
MTQSDFWLKVWTVGSTCYYKACIALWRSVKRISDRALHAVLVRCVLCASVLVLVLVLRTEHQSLALGPCRKSRTVRARSMQCCCRSRRSTQYCCYCRSSTSTSTAAGPISDQPSGIDRLCLYLFICIALVVGVLCVGVSWCGVRCAAVCVYLLFCFFRSVAAMGANHKSVGTRAVVQSCTRRRHRAQTLATACL